MESYVFKVSHHPGGSFKYLAHVLSLTCKPDSQPDNASLTRIEIVSTNPKKKGRSATILEIG